MISLEKFLDAKSIDTIEPVKIQASNFVAQINLIYPLVSTMPKLKVALFMHTKAFTFKVESIFATLSQAKQYIKDQDKYCTSNEITADNLLHELLANHRSEIIIGNADTFKTLNDELQDEDIEFRSFVA